MNLLPTTEKETVKKGFRQRYLIIILLLVLCALIAGTVMLIPAYLLADARLNEIEIEFQSVNDHNDPTMSEFTKVPREIQSKLQVFEKNLEDSSVVSKIAQIAGARPAGLTINSFSYSHIEGSDDESDIKIAISGKAATRKSLITFAENLRGFKEFSDVDVPVSNLTKEKDIPFSINLLVKHEQ